jgi:hypothetical protein
MALDTADKRSSAIGIARQTRAVFPTPDGAALTQADRQQSAYTYRGIAAGTFAIASIFGDLTTLFCGYERELRDADLVGEDINTLVVNDRATMWGVVGHGADLNTDYARYLS